MEKNFDQTNYLGAGSMPFQELEERFDDWVRWLHSIAHTSEDSLTTQLVDLRIKPGKYSTVEESDYDQQLEDEWRWVDDGGESGEVV